MRKCELKGAIKLSANKGTKYIVQAYEAKGQLKDGKIFYPDPYSPANFINTTDCSNAFRQEKGRIIMIHDIKFKRVKKDD